MTHHSSLITHYSSFQRARVLVVDDDRSMCGMLSRMVAKLGHDIVCAFSVAEGLGQASVGNFDVVFLDVRLPDGSGLEVLQQFRGMPSSPEVIIITAAGDPDGADLAIRSGAWDYIQKPSSVQEMKLPLVRALQYRHEKSQRGLSTSVLSLKRDEIIGSSPQMAACFDLLARTAGTDTTVLITGETGTGKELFASALHKNSARSSKPFIVVDCSALPESLVESILFGHEKGVFTGADRAKQGLIKEADGGTLFLDEVGELPLHVQKSFLRVLQERRFRPLGSKIELQSDFRLVAATNRDLDRMVRDGDFREDLLFRLKSVTINLPPLRERTGDIKELALLHVAKTCERYKIGLKGFAPEFIDALNCYPWPGNVRELLHTIERAVTAAYHEPTLFPNHLPNEIRIYLAKASLGKAATKNTDEDALTSGDIPCLREFREAMDKKYLQDLMVRTGGNIREVSRLSGVSRSRLYELLKLHGIPIPV